MADNDDDDTGYKLFRTVDPTKISVPIKSKFAKLTLSAKKTKKNSAELEKITKEDQNFNQNKRITPNVMDKICEMPTESLSSLFENPLCCSESTAHGSAFYWQQADTQQNTLTDIDDELQEIQTENESMEPLQVSEDLTAPRNILSTQTTPKHETSLCITISDTNSDYKDTITEPEPSISDYNHGAHDLITSANNLCDDKISRINAFLRDVSVERKNHANRDEYIQPEIEINRQLAQADTESMSQTTEILSQCVPIDYKSPTQKIVQHITKGINMIEIDDGESEVNKSNAEFHSFTSKTSSSADRIRNSITDESITVPETSSEAEILNDSQNSKKTNLDGINSSSMETTDTSTSSVVPIHLNSINISAKFNIKIHISNAEATASTSSVSSNGTSDDSKTSRPATNTNEKKSSQYQNSKLHIDSDCEEDRVQSSEDAEEENFIDHAEELLNELYGNSWQTPNVIKTLKRTNGSGSGIKNPKSVSRTTRPEKITPKKQDTTTKCTAVKNESVLDDFSIFRSKIIKSHMDSTHLKTPTIVQPKEKRLDNIRNENRFRGTQSENKKKSNLKEERWRQLIDSDSDIESDNDKDCKDDIISIASTISGSSSNSQTNNDIEEILPTKKREKREKDQKVRTPLATILRTCQSENRPKLKPTGGNNDVKIKRKLFVPNTGYEDEEAAEAIIRNARFVSDDLLDDLENVYMPDTPVYKRVQEIKRQISGGESDKKKPSKPIFKLPTAVKTPASKSTKTRLLDKFEETNTTTPNQKYSFLKSLEDCVSKSLCDPKALMYRENYSTKKDELAHHLYAMFITKLFNNAFTTSIVWNKKLTSTAGRCSNRKSLGRRTSVIELSDKVLTKAERLCCTLIHELCHAATWILHEQTGHGSTWKMYAARANQTFPELPKIGVCHNYEIEYKYTYQCIQCSAKSHAHSKSKKVENIRCFYCHGDIELFRNKKDKDGNNIAMPVKEATGFAKFVKDHYKRYKRPDLKHADVMKILSGEFANLKVSSN